jgi:ribonuclease HI
MIVASVILTMMFVPTRQIFTQGFAPSLKFVPLSPTATVRRKSSILFAVANRRRLFHCSFSTALFEKRKMTLDHRCGHLNMTTPFSSSSLSRTSVRRMKVAELRNELQVRGLPTSGVKNELVSRLLEHLETNSTRGRQEKQHDQIISSVSRHGNKDKAPSTIILDPTTLYVLRFHGIQNHLSATSCCGLILYDSSNDREIWSGTQYYQSGESSNEAELTSLLLILSNLSKMGLKRLVIQGLAKGTTVNQLQGNYGVKNKRLKPLFDKIEKLMKQELDECEVWGIATDQVKGVQQLAKKYLELGTSVGFDFFLQEQANSDQDSVRDNARQSDVVGPKNNSVQEYDVVPEETFHGMIPPTLSPDKQYVLRFDGGSRGNPGVSGAGIAIYDLESGDEVWAAFQYLGETTNNVAEYNALLSGLELARSMGITRLIAEGDSTLVVKQVSGEYEVKSKHLIDLNQRVKRIAESFQSFSLQYIPRAENFRADKLANVAMDERISMGLEVSTTNPTRYDDTEGRYDITYSDTKDFRIQPMSIEASPSLSTTNVLSLIPEPLLSERQLSAFRTFVLRFGGKKKGESSIGSASLLIDDLSNEEIWAGTYFKHENVNQFIPAYIGLIIGLRKAMAMGVTRLIVESHIEFVIQQMAGKWSVKSKAIQPYYEVAKNLIDNYFEDVDFQLIDSNNNNAVKDMIDEAIISHKTQLPGFK